MAQLITTGFDPFHRELRTRLEADLASLKETLVNNLARDIEHYRYMCGTIVALQQVLEHCQEIEAKMQGVVEASEEG